MNKNAPRMRQRSFREEVEALAREQTAECEERTTAEVMTLGSVGPAERAVRMGWLRAKCRRCGLCALAGGDI